MIKVGKNCSRRGAWAVTSVHIGYVHFTLIFLINHSCDDPIDFSGAVSQDLIDEQKVTIRNSLPTF